MSFVMLTCTVGLLSGGWDLGWHQYTTSSHATTLESNKGLQALLEVNLRLATTGYLSNGYDDPQPGLRYRFCCPVRLYPSQRVKSHIAQHVVFSDVIVPGDQQRVRRYPPYRKFSADNAWNPTMAKRAR